MNYEEFWMNRKTVNAVVRSLEVLGEATRSLPSDLREQYPEVPWRQMVGTRDKLIHEYFGVDLKLIWAVVKDDLPKLRPQIEEILRDQSETEEDRTRGLTLVKFLIGLVAGLLLIGSVFSLHFFD